MTRYGLNWPEPHPLPIEMRLIRSGGYLMVGGVRYGHGLFHHFREMESLIWPEDYHNRWTDWMLKIILEERIACSVEIRMAAKPGASPSGL